MTWDPTVANVYSNYTGLGSAVQAKRKDFAGGFSGSKLWQIETSRGRWRLCRWPQNHPDRQRLTFIHQVLRGVAAKGLPFVAPPLETKRGLSFVEQDGHFWELTAWLPGFADFHARPSDARLAAAMHALAEFHQAAANLPLMTASGPAPALVERHDQLGRLLAGDLQQYAAAVEQAASNRRLAPFLSVARDCLALAASIGPPLLPRLAAAAEQRLPLQPAIRDIHHDHVLFVENRVSGIIDYGALRIDTPLTDIARLVGSLVADDRGRRDFALAAYAGVRSLSDDDRKLIDLLDASGVLLGAMNWTRWLFVDARQFEDLAAVLDRLANLAERLRNLAASHEA